MKSSGGRAFFAPTAPLAEPRQAFVKLRRLLRALLVHTVAMTSSLCTCARSKPALLSALLVLLLSCASPQTAADEPRAELLVLGTAQDAGVPQLGCRAACCEAVRAGRAPRRLVASVAIGLASSGQRWLIDCGPDLRAQEELLRGFPAGRSEIGPRPALCEGILLTHAHMGHIAGLLQLGREAAAARGLPVWCGPRLAALLRTQAPWHLLVEAGHIVVHEVLDGGVVQLAPGLSAEALQVPHRAECSETYAWIIRGPQRSVLYCPDIDRFSDFAGGVEALLARADCVLLDGTFWSLDEIPGRGTADIPHPPIARTLELLAGRSALLRKLCFTHLNHTNPAGWADSPQAHAVRAAGACVLQDGQVLQL